MSQRFPPHNHYAPRPPHPNSRFDHSDRYLGRASQRSRSPTRDRRDSRDFGPPAREVPPVRYPRDGPPSAGPTPPDHARYPPVGYGRGRGRPPDWGARGRTRYPDERDNFRRSPSWGPRRERQDSVDSREIDRRDDFRDRDYRDDDRRYRRREDFRPLPPRLDTRHPSDARSDSIPSPNDRSGRPPSPHRRTSPIDKRDHEFPRRPSMLDKDGRRDSEPARPPRERSPDRTQTRLAEETSSVAVPQFGFIPPVLMTPVKMPISPQPLPKIIPTAPRAQLPGNVPTGPKAELLVIGVKDQVPAPALEDHKPREHAPTAPVAVNILPATSPPSEPSILDSPAIRTQSLDASPAFTVRQLAPAPVPTGPRASSQPLARASSAGPPSRDAPSSSSLTPFPPSGSRVTIPQLPNGLPDNIPTGPRAMNHRPPPTAPRGYRPQLTSLQWRPNEPSVPPRAPSIPVKRDVNGDEKERTPVPERIFDATRIAYTTPSYMDIQRTNDTTTKPSSTQSETPKAAVDEDVHMADAPRMSPVTPAMGKVYYSSEEEDLDEEDFEEDFQEQEDDYRSRKARLEEQLQNIDRLPDSSAAIQEIDKANAILAIMHELPMPSSPERSAPRSPLPIDEDITMAEDGPTKSPTPEGDEAPSPAPSAMQPVVPLAPRELTPEMSKSPDFEYLPYLEDRPPTPISNSETLEGGTDDDLQDLIDAEIEDVEQEDEEKQKALGEHFKSLYTPWKKMAVLLDSEKVVIETIPKEPKVVEIEIPEPRVEPVIPPLATPNESRRLHKYSSELDLERALEESRREEELRLRKAEKDKIESLPNVEREANVPALLTPNEMQMRNFKDTSLLRNPEDSLRVFEFAPPKDTFTPEQSREFAKLWKKNPKAWHIIADSLRMSTKECIYHYYATKWEKHYKGGKARKPKGLSRMGNRRGAMLGARNRLEIDSENQETTPVGLTETGRPRRAAAPTFSKPAMGKGDQESELEPALAGKRVAGNKTDNGLSEGRASARGRMAKEKPARKPRNQLLAAKGTAASSPQKLVRDKKDKPPSVTQGLAGEGEEWIGKRESVPPQERLMPTMIPQQQQQQQLSYHADINFSLHRDANSESMPPDAASATHFPPARIERPRSHSNTKQQGTSSYWSVQEENEFQLCLAYYGTDFQQIAKHMDKKTPVMIKNHYLKYHGDESKREIVAAAKLADQKKSNGESPEEMPQSLKKSMQSNTQSMFRPIMPNEPIEVESPTRQKPMLRHGSPSMRSLSGFQQGLPPHSVPPSQVPMPNRGVLSPLGPASGHKQPRMAYSHESPIRQAQGQPPQPHMSPPMMLLQEPTRAIKQVDRIKTEHDPHRPTHQPLGRERSNTGNALTAVQRQQGFPSNVAAYPMANIRLVSQTYGLQPDQSFGGSQVPHSAPAAPRNVIDLTAHSPGGFDPRGPRPQSPAIRDYTSGRGYDQRNATPPAGTSRNMNIMSMLNPTDEQPAPASAHPAAPSQASASAYPTERESRWPPQPPEPLSIQRDNYVRDQPQRPAYSTHDRDTPLSASSVRESNWPVSRVNVSHPYAESPRLAPQPPTSGDLYRSALGVLNPHPRHIPSPPPAAAPGAFHSRSSSYSTHPPPTHSSTPISAGGTPTEAYPHSRSSLQGNTAYTSAPPQPLAPAHSAPTHHSHSHSHSHSRDAPYPSGPPSIPYAPPRQDRSEMYEPHSSAFRAFRNTRAGDYDSRSPGAPPLPPSQQQQHQQPPPPSAHNYQPPSHSSPQPPGDHQRYQPPPRIMHTPLGYEQRGMPPTRDDRYADDMRRRELEEDRRRASGGGPSQSTQPPPARQ